MDPTLSGSLTCWTRRTSWSTQTSSTFHPPHPQYTRPALITTTEVMAVRWDIPRGWWLRYWKWPWIDVTSYVSHSLRMLLFVLEYYNTRWSDGAVCPKTWSTGCDMPHDVNVEFLPRCRVRAQTVWSLMKRFPISCSSPWPSDTLSPRPKPAHFPTGSGQPVRRLRTSVRSSSRYQTLTISCVYAIFSSSIQQTNSKKIFFWLIKKLLRYHTSLKE